MIDDDDPPLAWVQRAPFVHFHHVNGETLMFGGLECAMCQTDPRPQTMLLGEDVSSWR